MPFVTHLEEDYDKLSPRNKVIEILHQLGKTDMDMTEIMVITPSTLRVTKTRIKERLKKSPSSNEFES
jgi:hypothetical protein